MRPVLLALPLCLLLLPSRGDAATLRCGTELVSDGATPADVQLKCGAPMARNSREEAVSQRQRAKGEQGDTTTQHVVYKTIDEWTYNFGPNRLIQVVVFENGRLVDVRSGGYGR